jgi:predicted Zn-dependent protease with MMP-like domain
MSPTDQLGFAISDRVDDIEVGPQHVPLALLGEFQKDVAEFLRGSNRDVDPAKVQVSIESGSLSLIASGLLAATTLWGDLDSLETSRSLGAIDSKRASVLERWQAGARQHPNRRYKVFNKASGKVLLAVDRTSYLKSAEDVWVHVEKYLHGKVVDMGGKTKANVHLELENGQTITIASSQELLAEGERNRLYREELLHVTAEENLTTGELRNFRLLGFENYHPRYDEDEFKRMVERGTKAWKDMPDSWLEDLRGGEA